MIKEIIFLFFMILAASATAVIGAIATEGIVKRVMPTTALYANTLWMTLKIKAYDAKEKIAGWWNHTTGVVSNGYEKTKRRLASVIPFRHNQQQAEA